MEQIPYIVYEDAEARSERTIKRLVFALVITIVFMFVSNGLWLWAWTQYDYMGEDDSITVSQDSRGINSVNLGTQGDVEYGADSDDSAYTQNENEEKWTE